MWGPAGHPPRRTWAQLTGCFRGKLGGKGAFRVEGCLGALRGRGRAPGAGAGVSGPRSARAGVDGAPDGAYFLFIGQPVDLSMTSSPRLFQSLVQPLIEMVL